MTPSSAKTRRQRLDRRALSWYLKGLFAVLAVMLAAGFAPHAAQAETAETQDVGVMATHKSPFNCGKTFYANNWSPGHKPSGSIDWQSYGGDAIGGETVRATAGGTARFYSTLSAAADDIGIMAYGKYVVIEHGDGTKTRYAHLASMVKAPKQSMSVSRGTKIGTVGATGVSAAHLHYEQITSSGSIDTSPTVEGVTVSLGQKKSIKSTNNCSGGGNPYTPKEICGTDYGVIDSASLSGGRVYLLYNSGNGYNCVVTLKTSNVGSPSSVSAFLEPRNGSRKTDSGKFSYYAGPVKKYAPGVCVKWGGSIGSSSYTSPFEHCGS